MRVVVVCLLGCQEPLPWVEGQVLRQVSILGVESGLLRLWLVMIGPILMLRGDRTNDWSLRQSRSVWDHVPACRWRPAVSLW